jgi:hypothetical protein
LLKKWARLPLQCFKHSGAWLTFNEKVNEMENKNEVIKAFRKARIVGEHLLSTGKISWEQFEFTMLGFELQLRGMGVDF